eukprot:scaffold14042_cov31-Tisochrysis_lutea.AAC.1
MLCNKIWRRNNSPVGQVTELPTNIIRRRAGWADSHWFQEENFVIEQGTLCDVFAQAFAAGEHSIDS